MKIVRPYMRMLTTGQSILTGFYTGYIHGVEEAIIPPLGLVNWAGRISHRSEDAEKQDIERFLRSVVLDHGDWSIVEHAYVSVDALVDRGITHEIVRHRIASYTQESTRFVNYQKKMPPSFIYPKPEVECPLCLAEDQPYNYDGNVFAHGIGGCAGPCPYDIDWLLGIHRCEEAYKRLLEKGWRPQEARSVFPNALASRIVITMNLRTWRHFFIMRTTKEAHPQMRQVTIPLLEEFKRNIPVLYEDIEPNAKQSESMKKGR